MSVYDKLEYYQRRYLDIKKSYERTKGLLDGADKQIEMLKKQNKVLHIQAANMEDEIQLLTKRRISEDRKNRLVSSLINRVALNTHPIILIVSHSVCEHFQVTPEKLVSRSRKREFALPRQVTHYIIKKKFPELFVSLETIGIEVGNVDHATVIHSIRKVSDLMEFDDDLFAAVEKITNICKDRYSLYKQKVYNTKITTND